MYPTDTKGKTGNHHFNAHRSPSSQDERIPTKPVLTGQHVLSNSSLFSNLEKYFLSLLGRFNAVLGQRSLGLFI